ncbi:MAG: MBL fold metallo-hydrolase [Gammaproteobacteria bacterium]|nr:MBL fold metallo-hydrolase [Gammaproteobacteria bacterium]MBU0786152.1 MBL fold metallo-hydrolase [Gammaproteobacteria bacterium]MBU0816732.1 MBL fold metallo-hydrolase [Gammaproteobacteria bacterium]MBU1786896.1 MBL fold metallo-hydrolase [Gammaproteobacteria bacterium]
MLRFRSLGSGSSGNATLVEASSGHRLTRLLIDCGFGLKHLETRLARTGLATSQIDAVFITHEHGDHIGCARQLALRHQIPIWMSQGTHAALDFADFGGLLQQARDGEAIDLGELQLMPFTVPHDAREPLQLTCTDGATRLGVVTDLGHATSHVLHQLAGCHALLLECNHDTEMLATSRYPPFLKQRVGGRLGHLSNQDAADIAAAVCHPALQHLVAAHLSQQNNHPDLARQAMSSALGREPEDIAVANPVQGTDWFCL